MDSKQKIWLQFTSLALAGGAVLSMLVVHDQLAGRSLLRFSHMAWALGIFWLTSISIVLTIASGFSKHYRDGALSMHQMFWAVNTTLIFMTASTGSQTPYLLLVVLVMTFGVFRVDPRRFYFFSAYCLIAFSIQEILLYRYFGEARSVADFVVLWIVFAVTTFALFTFCKAFTRLRTRLKERNEELQYAMEVKESFLANVSHEIRTPINGIVGMVELLMKTPLDENQRHKLSLAKSSSESLLVLINDILDFSKIQADQLLLESIEFNLLDLLGKFSESMAISANVKGVEVVLDVSEVEHGIVLGDPTRLKQILTNIVGNAIKFTQQGEILISAKLELVHEPDSEEKYRFACCIKDTGVGIAQDKIAGLFDAFTQEDVSTTRKYGGTGLGLSISKRLCEIMGGSITCESELGKGTTFQFHVNFGIASKDIIKPKPQVEEGFFAIFVDDHPATLNALSNQFAAWGIEHATCESLQGLQTELITLIHKNVTRVGVFICENLLLEDGNNTLNKINESLNDGKIHYVLMTDINRDFNEVDVSCESIIYLFPKPAITKDLTESLSAIADDNKSLVTSVSKSQTGGLHVDLGDEGDSIAPPDVNDEQTSPTFKLLLVDDNEINREVALGLLEDFGVEAETAENGKEAIEKLQAAQSPYLLILMDCQMPVMDGFSASRKIREGAAGDIYKKIPIIALTANVTAKDRENCTQAGMDDFLTKPIDPSALEASIQLWKSRVHA